MTTLAGTLPWTRSCVVCGEQNPRGFHLRSRLEGGCVVIDYTTRETDVGYRCLVHGGVLMTLLDEVMTWAAIAATRRMCVAAELTTRLRRPVRVGAALRIEAPVPAQGGRLLTVLGRVTDAAGAVVAEASGRYVVAAADEQAAQQEDFVAREGALKPEDVLD